MSPVERFLSHTRSDPSGCLLWTGSRDRLGYGRFRIGKRSTDTGHRAHHAAWLLMVGPIQPGLMVRHRCDNPPCVSLDHLELGTHDDNMRDRSERSRQARGVSHGLSKLTPEKVLLIRDLRARGWTEVAIAREIGISRGGVSSVALGKTWGWM